MAEVTKEQECESELTMETQEEERVEPDQEPQDASSSAVEEKLMNKNIGPRCQETDTKTCPVIDDIDKNEVVKDNSCDQVEDENGNKNVQFTEDLAEDDDKNGVHDDVHTINAHEDERNDDLDTNNDESTGDVEDDEVNNAFDVEEADENDSEEENERNLPVPEDNHTAGGMGRDSITNSSPPASSSAASTDSSVVRTSASRGHVRVAGRPQGPQRPPVMDAGLADDFNDGDEELFFFDPEPVVAEMAPDLTPGELLAQAANSGLQSLMYPPDIESLQEAAQSGLHGDLPADNVGASEFASAEGTPSSRLGTPPLDENNSPAVPSAPPLLHTYPMLNRNDTHHTQGVTLTSGPAVADPSASGQQPRPSVERLSFGPNSSDIPAVTAMRGGARDSEESTQSSANSDPSLRVVGVSLATGLNFASRLLTPLLSASQGSTSAANNNGNDSQPQPSNNSRDFRVSNNSTDVDYNLEEAGLMLSFSARDSDVSIPTDESLDPEEKGLDPSTDAQNKADLNSADMDGARNSEESADADNRQLASAENDFLSLEVRRNSSSPVIDHMKRTEQDADALLNQIITGRAERGMGPNTGFLTSGYSKAETSGLATCLAQPREEKQQELPQATTTTLSDDDQDVTGANDSFKPKKRKRGVGNESFSASSSKAPESSCSEDTEEENPDETSHGIPDIHTHSGSQEISPGTCIDFVVGASARTCPSPENDLSKCDNIQTKSQPHSLNESQATMPDNCVSEESEVESGGKNQPHLYQSEHFDQGDLIADTNTNLMNDTSMLAENEFLEKSETSEEIANKHVFVEDNENQDLLSPHNTLSQDKLPTAGENKDVSVLMASSENGDKDHGYLTFTENSEHNEATHSISGRATSDKTNLNDQRDPQACPSVTETNHISEDHVADVAKLVTSGFKESENPYVESKTTRASQSGDLSEFDVGPVVESVYEPTPISDQNHSDGEPGLETKDLQSESPAECMQHTLMSKTERRNTAVENKIKHSCVDHFVCSEEQFEKHSKVEVEATQDSLLQTRTFTSLEGKEDITHSLLCSPKKLPESEPDYECQNCEGPNKTSPDREATKAFISPKHEMVENESALQTEKANEECSFLRLEKPERNQISTPAGNANVDSSPPRAVRCDKRRGACSDGAKKLSTSKNPNHSPSMLTNDGVHKSVEMSELEKVNAECKNVEAGGDDQCNSETPMSDTIEAYGDTVGKDKETPRGNDLKNKQDNIPAPESVHDCDENAIQPKGDLQKEKENDNSTERIAICKKLDEADKVTQISSSDESNHVGKTDDEITTADMHPTGSELSTLHKDLIDSSKNDNHLQSSIDDIVDKHFNAINNPSKLFGGEVTDVYATASSPSATRCREEEVVKTGRDVDTKMASLNFEDEDCVAVSRLDISSPSTEKEPENLHRNEGRTADDGHYVKTRYDGTDYEKDGEVAGAANDVQVDGVVGHGVFTADGGPNTAGGINPANYNNFRIGDSADDDNSKHVDNETNLSGQEKENDSCENNYDTDMVNENNFEAFGTETDSKNCGYKAITNSKEARNIGDGTNNIVTGSGSKTACSSESVSEQRHREGDGLGTEETPTGVTDVYAAPSSPSMTRCREEEDFKAGRDVDTKLRSLNFEDEDCVAVNRLDISSPSTETEPENLHMNEGSTADGGHYVRCNGTDYEKDGEVAGAANEVQVDGVVGHGVFTADGGPNTAGGINSVNYNNFRIGDSADDDNSKHVGNEANLSLSGDICTGQEKENDSCENNCDTDMVNENNFEAFGAETDSKNCGYKAITNSKEARNIGDGTNNIVTGSGSKTACSSEFLSDQRHRKGDGLGAEETPTGDAVLSGDENLTIESTGRDVQHRANATTDCVSNKDHSECQNEDGLIFEHMNADSMSTVSENCESNICFTNAIDAIHQENTASEKNMPISPSLNDEKVHNDSEGEYVELQGKSYVTKKHDSENGVTEKQNDEDWRSFAEMQSSDTLTEAETKDVQEYSSDFFETDTSTANIGIDTKVENSSSSCLDRAPETMNLLQVEQKMVNSDKGQLCSNAPLNDYFETQEKNMSSLKSVLNESPDLKALDYRNKNGDDDGYDDEITACSSDKLMAEETNIQTTSDAAGQEIHEPMKSHTTSEAEEDKETCYRPDDTQTYPTIQTSQDTKPECRENKDITPSMSSEPACSSDKLMAEETNIPTTSDAAGQEIHELRKSHTTSDAEEDKETCYRPDDTQTYLTIQSSLDTKPECRENKDITLSMSSEHIDQTNVNTEVSDDEAMTRNLENRSSTEKVILEATDLWLKKISDFCKSPTILSDSRSDAKIHRFTAECKSQILSISKCKLGMSASMHGPENPNDLSDDQKSYTPSFKESELPAINAWNEAALQLDKPQTKSAFNAASRHTNFRPCTRMPGSSGSGTFVHGRVPREPPLPRPPKRPQETSSSSSQWDTTPQTREKHHLSDGKGASGNCLNLPLLSKGHSSGDVCRSETNTSGLSTAKSHGDIPAGPYSQNERCTEVDADNFVGQSMAWNRACMNRLRRRLRTEMKPEGSELAADKTCSLPPHPPQTPPLPSQKMETSSEAEKLQTGYKLTGDTTPDWPWQRKPTRRPCRVRPPAKTEAAGQDKASIAVEQNRSVLVSKEAPAIREKVDASALHKRYRPQKILTVKEFEKQLLTRHLNLDFRRINKAGPSVDCHIDPYVMRKAKASIERQRAKNNYNSLLALENCKFLHVLRYTKSVYHGHAQAANTHAAGPGSSSYGKPRAAGQAHGGGGGQHLNPRSARQNSSAASAVWGPAAGQVSDLHLSQWSGGPVRDRRGFTADPYLQAKIKVHPPQPPRYARKV